MTTRQSPPVKDSDIIWLCIKKLEAAAARMTNLQYDETLENLLNEASEWFGWAAFNISGRSAEQVEDVEIDPFERAATIAETMTGINGEPATGETIAAAIRAWKPKKIKVSETTREEIEKL